LQNQFQRLVKKDFIRFLLEAYAQIMPHLSCGITLAITAAQVSVQPPNKIINKGEGIDEYEI
jgi:hypothetical protein